MRLIISWLINTVALVVVANVVPGVSIRNSVVAMFAGLLLALFNFFLKPLIILITLPINVLSLGLFTLVINAFLLFLVSKMITGFVIETFLAAFLGALIVSAINIILNTFIRPSRQVRVSVRWRGDRAEKQYREVIDAEVVQTKKHLPGSGGKKEK